MQDSLTPDFIGIGAIKSATTWIANCLREHPEICLSEPKGVRYFNLYQNYFNGHPRCLNKNHTKPLSWYLNHFRHCQQGQIKGEFSPMYLYDGTAPSGIQSYFPNVKLIVCLRNPIDRAYSHYWMHRGSSQIDIPFEDAIRKETMYIEMGFYSKQLKRYQQHFDRDKMLILLFDEIVHHPEKEIKRVLQFLDVSTDVKPGITEKSYMNPSKKIKSSTVEKCLYSTSRRLIDMNLGFLIHLVRKAGIVDLITRVNTTPLRYPPMNTNTRGYLGDIFRGDIKELEALLDRDLAHWR